MKYGKNANIEHLKLHLYAILLVEKDSNEIC